MSNQFPKMHNSGTPKINETDNTVNFWYMDSRRAAVNDTMPLLPPEAIVRLTTARLEGFKRGGPGTRESEASRAKRKWISAHPQRTLLQAWQLMDEDTRMEFVMMLDEKSHHGISDSLWLAKREAPTGLVHGDDGLPL